MTSHNNAYKEKHKSVDEVAALVESGWVCATDSGISIPYDTFAAVGERVRNGELRDITLHTFLELQPLPYFDAELSKEIKGVSWFSAGARKPVNKGLVDVAPNYFRDVPSLFLDYVDIDALFLVVSPMDKHGYFSTCNATSSFSLLKKAKRLYIEVNKNMPRVATTSSIHISHVTALCENDKELPTLAPPKSDEITDQIGSIIAEQVPNGATLQFGIGAVPNAVGMLLKNKRDLGIHSEMFGESMLELLECGAANNSKKPIHTGRTVATFAYGPKLLYEFVDDNPGVEMLPVNYTNDPAIIAKHPNMISINAAVEVDFFGQVCAESVGTRHLSGAGGQPDFVRGAVLSPGGKSFIAFPSTVTTADGKISSRICPVLQHGSVVTTSKNDVDHIVTEYGIAKLRGQSVYQRARALISIAHPDFRDELTFKARELNIMI